MEHSLWVEKYRPIDLSTYIGNEHLKSKVKLYLENEDVPHLLLYGRAGTGKTTLAKVIVGSTVSKRVDKFFKEDSVGMALAGRGKFFKEFRNTTQIGGVLEEASEEYIEMVASSILDLEKDNREERGMTYAEGILDSVLFPVKYPDQAAAILISVGILPTGVV